MSKITDIKEQINDLTTFKHISTAFLEAAAVKLRNIRKAFERNDRFYESMIYIYHLVEINAGKEKVANKKSAPAGIRQLTVAMTSNQRFFGTVNNEIMAKVLAFSIQRHTELMIIGTTGESYLRALNYNKPYQSITFLQDIPNQKESEVFLTTISPFDSVTIFYPKFISFLKQEAGSIEITSKIPSLDAAHKDQLKDEINLIFEPELSKMVRFFESEVRMILFKRVLLETDLARTAARLLSMSQAEERSDYEIRLKKLELRKVSRSFTNAQLLETFSGIKKWKHGMSTRRTLAEMKNKVLFISDLSPVPIKSGAD